MAVGKRRRPKCQTDLRDVTMRREILGSLMVVLVLASPSWAQPRGGMGVGVGVGVGRPWGWGYPYAFPFWGYPGAYGSSYSNGFNLYGPPVPTYGPTAGAFGGSDQRIDAFRGDPFGRNWVNLRQAPPASSRMAEAEMIVRVPDPNAEVWFDATATRSHGAERRFRTPPLPAGRNYLYTIRAKWMENGQEMNRERTITVTAGLSMVVEFGRESPPKSAEPPIHP
jgi:uncharacterized protein (TIGR03000 family)